MQNLLLQQTHNRLRNFFVESIKDIYYAEQRLMEMLDELREKATSQVLKDTFEDHRLETRDHVLRLEKVFNILEEEPETQKCKAILGIISEAESIISKTEKGTLTRDAALIFAVQKAEHYEIATYGTLVQFAKVLGLDDAAIVLEETLQEEKDTDELLTRIADGFINNRAMMEEEVEE